VYGLIRYITCVCRLLRCAIPLPCIILQHVYGIIRCIICSRRNINRENGYDGGRFRIQRATAIASGGS
jgi:hypothetical protein